MYGFDLFYVIIFLDLFHVPISDKFFRHVSVTHAYGFKAFYFSREWIVGSFGVKMLVYMQI